MAENGLSPPLFREALIQPGPWTLTDAWQRWLSAFWQQQATLWDKAQQPHVLGTGAASKVGIWQDQATLTSDSLLHWERGTTRLGVGTATPNHTVHVQGDVGIGATLLVQGATTLSGATTITAGLQVTGHVGIASAPPANVWLQSAAASIYALALGGGDVAPRWSLDCFGYGHVWQLGVGTSPLSTHTLVVGTGKTTFQAGAEVGIATEPVAGWSLTANTILAVSGMQTSSTLTVLGQATFHNVVTVSGVGSGNSNLIAYGFSAPDYAPGTANRVAYYSLVNAGSNCWGVLHGGTAPSQFGGSVTVLPTVGGFAVGTALNASYTALFYSSIGLNNGAGFQPGGGSWYNISSMRHLKRDIADLHGALGDLLRLRGRTWRWAEDQPALEADMPGVQVGFVLEEVEDTHPHWIREAEPGRKAYKEQGFSALVVEALRELTARVAALEGGATCR